MVRSVTSTSSPATAAVADNVERASSWSLYLR